ncbi:trypsin-like serine peptidase [Silvimonas amylolytica]|uniref:Serine protease n=1 Tax=Silvimonas amylolytica TaxID=449663 RepID=A0ABQ2PK19_9NEIS|nr:trypsin-like serine protease [Silvimonas amylolytica]GGP25566.1 serine protease [Silvimonas amylolytica]
MKRFFSALALLLACLQVAHAEPSEAAQHKIMFFGHDDRVMIHTPFAPTFSAIGVMRTQHQYDCTATLISPDTAVTAAHCFWMAGKSMDQGEWFMTAYDNGQYTAKYRVLSQIFNPQFKAGLDRRKDGVYITKKARQYDIAIIRVKLVEGDAPKPMNMFTGNRSQLQQILAKARNVVSQAGYPEDQDDIMAAHLRCKITALSADNTVFHRCDTLEGDSGSPLWVDTPQGPLLIAVQSSAPPYEARDDVDNIGVTTLQLPELPAR